MQSLTFASGRIELVQGDITTVRAEVVVTAANAGLQGGGGVDGAVHRAAGPELIAACRALGGCATGSAVITEAFALAQNGVRWVVHAVGPVWSDGRRGEPELLAGAYRTSFTLAEQAGAQSIALPSVSTGVYGFPVERAAPIAVGEAKAHLTVARHVTRVAFVLFDRATFEHFARALV